MPPILRLIGLLYAIGTGAGLWFLWPEVRAELRGTWFNDLWLPLVIIYALAGIWIAERIWAMIETRFQNNGA